MGKKTKQKQKRKYRDFNYSSIGDHRRIGKQLIPPFNSIPNSNSSSWRDDHAPEMLWALLLAATFPRDEYLSCFRQIVEWMHATFPQTDRSDEDTTENIPLSGEAFHDACKIDHTSLANLSDQHFKQFVSIPLAHHLGYGALRPLLLIDSLPGINRWHTELGVEPTEHDWQTLSNAIIASLDHQSEKSTDVRWLKCVLNIVLGKIRFMHSMREHVDEILQFPNKGDMRKVRPSIRAMEIAFRRNPPMPWIEIFWVELLTKTNCIDGSDETDYFKLTPPMLARDAILSARNQVAQMFHMATSSSRTDAKLDGAFGFTLYALSLLEEIAAPPFSQLLIGRIGLRSIAEVVITFTYLVKKNSATLWTTYRNFGSGQAKLAFLKMEQAVGDVPTFVDQETLFQIANEDTWQEFVNVDFGHWANKNLRDLAIESDTKEIYDRYYDWTSAFAHGHWCSIRDSNFITCHNPLHRLHRIPRPYHRIMPSVVPDAVSLVNLTFDLLEATYPMMNKLERIKSVASHNEITPPPDAHASHTGSAELHRANVHSSDLPPRPGDCAGAAA